jgi:hypothetical protein
MQGVYEGFGLVNKRYILIVLSIVMMGRVIVCVCGVSRSQGLKPLVMCMFVMF